MSENPFFDEVRAFAQNGMTTGRSSSKASFIGRHMNHDIGSRVWMHVGLSMFLTSLTFRRFQRQELRR